MGLTQVPADQRRLEIEAQHHEPFCFLSGSFTGSSESWSVPEKEGFAIVESMCRLDYLVSGHVVSICTDHANLVYIYDPYGKNPGIPRHTASKLMRWALKLSAFRYVVEHLPGERNVWADMLTRWAVGTNSGIRALEHQPAITSLMIAPVNPRIYTRLDWPSLQDITMAQEKSKTIPHKDLRRSKAFGKIATARFRSQKMTGC